MFTQKKILTLKFSRRTYIICTDKWDKKYHFPKMLTKIETKMSWMSDNSVSFISRNDSIVTYKLHAAELQQLVPRFMTLSRAQQFRMILGCIITERERDDDPCSTPKLSPAKALL